MVCEGRCARSGARRPLYLEQRPSPMTDPGTNPLVFSPPLGAARGLPPADRPCAVTATRGHDHPRAPPSVARPANPCTNAATA
eukprot:5603659-Lingulodinium_polyedra.AAC.1